MKYKNFLISGIVALLLLSSIVIYSKNKIDLEKPSQSFKSSEENGSKIGLKKPFQSPQTIETEEGKISTEEEPLFSEIDECINGVLVDFTSNTAVKNERDVEIVFNKYIDWAKENKKSIFGYGNDWRFESATIHGLYKNTRYWKVTASWLSKEDQKWRIKTVFDVSENGEVVRFLGCI